jgi:hypothetical protein
MVEKTVGQAVEKSIPESGSRTLLQRIPHIASALRNRAKHRVDKATAGNANGA